MTYAVEAAKRSRFAFTIVQLDLENTISPGGNEYHCSGRSPLGQRFYSSIVENGYDPVPTKMRPGEGVPFSGSVSFTMQDFPFGEKGTYFGKLIASNPYYLDRPVKVWTGFYDGVTFDWSNFKEKLYFLKRIDGPDSRGRVRVVADDLMTLLNDEDARVTSSPNAALASALNATDTGTIDVTDNDGIFDLGGYVKIDDEYIRYSLTLSNDSISILDRGALGSTATTHDAGAEVINCYGYSAENVVDVIEDVLDKYSPIDTSTYINLTDWHAERDSYLSGDNVTGVIDGGEPIREKINELCKQTSCSVWWDDEAQEMKIKAIGPTVTPVVELNSDDHILNVGETTRRDPSRAVTTIIAYYGLTDQSADKEDRKNYSEVIGTPDALSTAGYGKDKVEVVYCPDIPSSGAATVNKFISRTFSQRSAGVTEYTFRLDARDSSLLVGDEVRVTTDLIQSASGERSLKSYLVVEKDQVSPTVFQYTARATGFLVTGQYRTIAPDTLSGVTYATATTEQREQYAFIADDVTGEFSNGDDPHLLI